MESINLLICQHQLAQRNTFHLSLRTSPSSCLQSTIRLTHLRFLISIVNLDDASLNLQKIKQRSVEYNLIKCRVISKKKLFYVEYNLNN